MYVITYKGKPATLDTLYNVEQGPQPYSAGYHSLYDYELSSYLTNKTKRECINLFLHYFGFTWKERAQHIDVMKARV